jgi:hypothetical protein
MTPDERKMLTDLADKIAQTPAPPRDPEAEELIRTKIGKRPDALYLMTQTVLIQNMALQQAQRQMQEMQQQSRPAASSSSGSFLGGGGGQGSQYNNPGPSSQPQYQQPAYQQPAMATPSGAPSFLRGAAQTAAGVAAGALAFEGIRSMFSHPGYGGGEGFGGGFGGGGFGGGGFGDRPVEETVVNNYYDSPGGGGTDDLSLGDNRDNFADTGNDASYNDPGLDDTSDLDLGDNSGGFDGGGGDDFS